MSKPNKLASAFSRNASAWTTYFWDKRAVWLCAGFYQSVFQSFTFVCLQNALWKFNYLRMCSSFFSFFFFNYPIHLRMICNSGVLQIVHIIPCENRYSNITDLVMHRVITSPLRNCSRISLGIFILNWKYFEKKNKYILHYFCSWSRLICSVDRYYTCQWNRLDHKCRHYIHIVTKHENGLITYYYGFNN